MSKGRLVSNNVAITTQGMLFSVNNCSTGARGDTHTCITLQSMTLRLNIGKMCTAKFHTRAGGGSLYVAADKSQSDGKDWCLTHVAVHFFSFKVTVPRRSDM